GNGEAGHGRRRPKYQSTVSIRLSDCEGRSDNATERVCSAAGTVCIIAIMSTHVRKNITLPRSLDERLRTAARKRGTTQSGLIVQLVETGLAAEASQVDRLLSFVGVIQGPPDLSETIDETVYGG